MTQICFIGSDGYMYCNAIRRGGTLITNPSGKWYKFLAKSRKRKSPDDDGTISGDLLDKKV